MRVTINLVNDGEETPDEVMIIHYRKPTENDAPELVAQYPIGMLPELPSGALLYDLLEGDMLILA